MNGLPSISRHRWVAFRVVWAELFNTEKRIVQKKEMKMKLNKIKGSAKENGKNEKEILENMSLKLSIDHIRYEMQGFK